jgi:hypothetical protein
MPLLFLTLLLKVSTVEECDATGAAIKTSARLKKIIPALKSLQKILPKKLLKLLFQKF